VATFFAQKLHQPIDPLEDAGVEFAMIGGNRGVFLDRSG
jgi:hypothetical protein